MPCLQSVSISSCLPICFPPVSFSVDLCFSSQKLLVAAISHRCGCVLASSSGQTTVFCFPGKFQQMLYVRLLPGVFVSDVVQPGLPYCPSQHPHFSSFFTAQHSEPYVIAGLMIVLKTLFFNSTGIFLSHMTPG